MGLYIYIYIYIYIANRVKSIMARCHCDFCGIECHCGSSDDEEKLEKKTIGKKTWIEGFIRSDGPKQNEKGSVCIFGKNGI